VLTGPTKQETRTIIVDLEKYSKKSGKQIWKRIAEELSKGSRRRAKINLYQLNVIAKKNKDKTFIVPGKVLGTGVVDGKVDVVCLDYSENAGKKVAQQKGKIFTIKEFLGTKPKADKMVIVK